MEPAVSRTTHRTQTTNATLSIQRYHICITVHHGIYAGISKPDSLTFTSGLPFDWIPTFCYDKAYKWLMKHSQRHRMVWAQSSSSFLVLTTTGQRLHGKITKNLVKWYEKTYQTCIKTYHAISHVSLTCTQPTCGRGRTHIPYPIESQRISFESCCAGVAVDDETWVETHNICDSLVIVEVSPVPGACIPCEANPLNLICHCKGSRQRGICSHILFVTHVVLKSGDPSEQKPMYNLKYMASKIAGAVKGAHRPKRVKQCLLKEDSSDKEEEEVPRLKR